jgi:hypothetical protein
MQVHLHSLDHSRFHRQSEKLENSIRGAFATAGSLLISILTILILFFGVFLERTK